MTPIDPQLCVRTGRLLTEWFEHPETTMEEDNNLAIAEAGFDPETFSWGDCAVQDRSPEQHEMNGRVMAFIAKRRRRAWKNNLSQVEVAMRMNEATKMVSPDNFKFLDEGVRERTGLEINPLWMMECLVRAGVLSPKEQVTALKELAQYTHSRVPTINHNTNVNVNPEDWLLELAKEEYKVIGVDIPITQPRQQRERGTGKLHEGRLAKRKTDTTILANHANSELAALESMIDEEWIESDDG